ncbi:hypothetical protein [Nocardia sp. NPDC051981]|uniref:hypothetical protein n=1 Tax=Nocardia sp. NPDC051981 TaxID=3155417 RepID=UPI003418C3DA
MRVLLFHRGSCIGTADPTPRIRTTPPTTPWGWGTRSPAAVMPARTLRPIPLGRKRGADDRAAAGGVGDDRDARVNQVLEAGLSRLGYGIRGRGSTSGRSWRVRRR